MIVTPVPPVDDPRLALMHDWVCDLDVAIDRLLSERGALIEAIAVIQKAATPTATPASSEVAAPAAPIRKSTQRKPPAKDAPARTQRRSPSTSSRPPIEQVAAVCREAKTNGSSVPKLLAARFNVPLSTAKNWPALARKAGLIDNVTPLREPVPVMNGSPAGVAVDVADAPKRVLLCDDCDAEFPEHSVRMLLQHTMKDHERRPSESEKLAVPSR